MFLYTPCRLILGYTKLKDNFIYPLAAERLNQLTVRKEIQTPSARVKIFRNDVIRQIVFVQEKSIEPSRITT